MNLAHPAWLLVWIVIPILSIVAVLLSRFRKQPWDSLAAERLRERLIRKSHPLPYWLALGMLLAAIGVLAFALARPQADAGTKTEKSEGRNVMIALDLSRSMRVQDVSPDRLVQAKILIYELLKVLGNDRVGLVGFAGTPALFAPLTVDHAAVKETVEQMDEEWVTMGGSDIAAAVRMSTEALKETGLKSNALIVISDGEENEGDLDAIIADAESAGVMIFAIGVGTEDGGFVPHPDYSGGFLIDDTGRKVLSRLQPDILRKLADGTNGRYVISGQSGDIPAMIEVAIQGMETFKTEGQETRIVIEFFQWAVFPAILFLMASIIVGTRWFGMTGLAIGAFIFMSSGESFASQIDDAKMAFSKKQYDLSRDIYRSLALEKSSEKAARYRLAEGLSAYEGQDYRGARQAYSGALLSEDDQVIGKAHEGLGNTLFQYGWMGLSGTRYPTGDSVPDMEDFDNLVRDQLKKMSEAKMPDIGETNEFIRINAIILNWSDAVRHYRSALERSPQNLGASRNSKLTMNYLKRLAELLEEDKENSTQEMSQMMQQQGQAQGNEGEPQDGDGDGEPKDGSGDEEPNPDGKGGDEPNDKKEDGSGDKEEGEEESEGNKDEQSNKSPEDNAREILKENSDLEKGPLKSGRRDFSKPKKDW